LRGKEIKSVKSGSKYFGKIIDLCYTTQQYVLTTIYNLDLDWPNFECTWHPVQT